MVPAAKCIRCDYIDPHEVPHGPIGSVNQCPTAMILLQSTYGNYGSTIWDCETEDHSSLTMNVYLCDKCAKVCADRIQISKPLDSKHEHLGIFARTFEQHLQEKWHPEALAKIG